MSKKSSISSRPPPPAYAPNTSTIGPAGDCSIQPLLATQDEQPMTGFELFYDCLTCKSSTTLNGGNTICKLSISDGFRGLHNSQKLELRGKMENTTWANFVRYSSVGLANRKVSLVLKTLSHTKLIKIQRKYWSSNKLLVKSPYNNNATIGFICPTFGLQKTFVLENKDGIAIAKFAVSGIKFACWNQKITITDINLNTEFGEVDLGDGTIAFHAGCPKNANLRVLIICAYLLYQAL